MEWRPIVDYPEYEVSNGGSVRRNGRVLKMSPNSCGYLHVKLWVNGIPKTTRVHRLVASAFIPNFDGKKDVDHINRIRTDNRVENLRWATRSENQINKPTRVEHRHIYRESSGSYQVQIRRNRVIVLRKTYPTLAEAITSRDTFLLTPGNGSVSGV
jgi:hypothetical protein